MNELVFFTTNRAKLAHFRHIGRLSDVVVKGFRERTFYASYDEPRLNNREALLTASYKSALKQWLRSGQSEQSAFFLEDTSVRIDALSTTSEIPGVNVKFWMEGMTLHQLNDLIQSAGGNRRVTVRSDIVVHVPHKFRSALGIDKEFLWLHGVTEGEIVESCAEPSRNLAYPWLNENSFNRWFIPRGAKVALSALPIDQANNYDFRAKAFKKMLEKIGPLLVKRSPNVRPPTQFLLPVVKPIPPILVICGYSCAGKTTLATMLSQHMGYLHLEASDFMQTAFWQRYGPSTNISIGDFAEAVLIDEPWVAAEPIANFIQRTSYGGVVVTGFRSERELDVFEAGLPSGRTIKLIFLEAGAKLRYERAQKRGREPNISSDQMDARDERERRMGLDEIRGTPGCFVTKNESSIAELGAHFISDFGPLLLHGAKSRTIARNLPTDLERLILLALKDVDASNKLTTTQISALIRAKFGTKTAKDNVSRYFNQDVHPYFEWHSIGGKNRFSLSTTGLSMARILETSAAEDPMRLTSNTHVAV